MVVYTFKDADDNDFGTFQTQDYAEAKKYAQNYRLKVVANEYVWDDSETLDDFTPVKDQLRRTRPRSGSRRRRVR